jgi:hypothetical protein
MRKIERMTNNTILNCKEWKKANTKVTYNADNDISAVFCYGCIVAIIGPDFLQLFDGNQQSNIVKSRLNAILSAHGGDIPTKVFQKDFQWYISMGGNIQPFQSGMVLH